MDTPLTSKSTIMCKVKPFLFFSVFFQMIIEQLEHERNLMAEAIAEKMREHQQLLQIKMDLGMEVAAYR